MIVGRDGLVSESDQCPARLVEVMQAVADEPEYLGEVAVTLGPQPYYFHPAVTINDFIYYREAQDLESGNVITDLFIDTRSCNPFRYAFTVALRYGLGGQEPAAE